VDLDAGRLFGWRGGRIHAAAQTLDGPTQAKRLVGDAQGFDNIDADRLRQVSEVCLEQGFLSSRLRLKLGKANANADFAHVESSGGFLNSSAGYRPTIEGFPTYPDPATGVALFAEASRWLSLAAGLYDGATHEGCHGRTGNRGPGAFFGTGGTPNALVGTLRMVVSF
jgi:carbohydrate-selective porin OprB